MPSSDHSRSPVSELSNISLDPESESELSNLRGEAELLAATIEKLKRFKPQKRRVGRPKASEEPPTETATDLLFSLSKFTSKLLTKIEVLEEKHENLEAKFKNFSTKEKSKLPEFPPSLYSTAVTNSLLPKLQSPKLQDFEDRLEQIEQDSLTDFIKLNGNSCKKLIEKVKKKEVEGTGEEQRGTKDANGQERRGEEENYNLRKEVVKIV